MTTCGSNTPQGGILFNPHAIRGTLFSASLEGHKCLGGHFKILILKYSPDFLFFIPLKAWVLKRVPLKGGLK
jgi:hypothetical protein